MLTPRSRRLPLLFLAALVLGVSAPSADRMPTVGTDLSFSELDGSADDLDGAADGVWTVAHDLVLAGRLTCGTDKAGGCAMRIEAGGQVVILPGAGIETGEIRLHAEGDLLVSEGAFVAADRGGIALSARGRLDVNGLVSASAAGRAGGRSQPGASVSLDAIGGPGRGVRVGASGTVLATGGPLGRNQVTVAGCGIEVLGMVAVVGSGPRGRVVMDSCEGLTVDGRDLGRATGTRKGNIDVQGGGGSEITLSAQGAVFLDGAELRVGGEATDRISVTSTRAGLSWQGGLGSVGAGMSTKPSGPARILLSSCDEIRLDRTGFAPANEVRVLEACEGVPKTEPDREPRLAELPSVFSGTDPFDDPAGLGCTPDLMVNDAVISTDQEFISCDVLTSINTQILAPAVVTYRAGQSIILGNDFSVESGAQFTAILDATVNTPPVITSDGGGPTAAKPVAENQTAVTTVTATDADVPAQTLTFSISGGADQAKFSIVGATGVLTFTAAPDFEDPTDIGGTSGDNIYFVQVTVTDNGSPNLTDVQNIEVTVTNVNEAPMITSYGGAPTATDSLPENATFFENIESVDPDGTVEGSGGLTYSITGGADQAIFGIVTSTGVFVFNAPPDFENPQDVGTDNVYDVQVTVTDPDGLTDMQDIAVTVTDVNDAPVITSNGGGATAMVDAAENQTTVTTVTATDADMPAQTLTFSISGGADQAEFSIVGTTGVLTFMTAPDFEIPTDVGGDNVYDVQVTVTDNGAPNKADVQDIAVTVTNVIEGPDITK